jgi:hypothetical protein
MRTKIAQAADTNERLSRTIPDCRFRVEKPRQNAWTKPIGQFGSICRVVSEIPPRRFHRRRPLQVKPLPEVLNRHECWPWRKCRGAIGKTTLYYFLFCFLGREQMAHMAQKPQLHELQQFGVRHVANSTWHHMAPHGALAGSRPAIWRRFGSPGSTIWRGLTSLFPTTVPCAPCAPLSFRKLFAAARARARNRPSVRGIIWPRNHPATANCE